MLKLHTDITMELTGPQMIKSLTEVELGWRKYHAQFGT